MSIYDGMRTQEVFLKDPGSGRPGQVLLSSHAYAEAGPTGDIETWLAF